MVYIRNKSAGPGIQARDFFEKKIRFLQEKTLYYYFTSLENDSEYPPSEQNVRAFIVFGFHKFERLEDGRIKCTLLL